VADEEIEHLTLGVLGPSVLEGDGGQHLVAAPIRVDDRFRTPAVSTGSTSARNAGPRSGWRDTKRRECPQGSLVRMDLNGVELWSGTLCP
jgi:hypothetical protein